MNRSRNRIGLPVRAAALLLVVALSGCAVITSTIEGVSGGVDRINRKAENAILSATGLADMQASMIAMVVYTNAFFAGGFMYGYDNFSEGEGVEWRVTAESEEERSTVTIERALLKRLGDGTSWWLLSYRDEESEFLSEALIGAEYELLVFRYKDPDTGEIREWIPESGEEESVEKESVEEEEEAEIPDYYDGSWESHIVGRGIAVVPAGSYQTDHVLIEDTVEYYYTDENGNEQMDTADLRYEWWVSDSVPGNLVKYSWEDGSDNSSLTGELVSQRSGYGTRLGSF